VTKECEMEKELINIAERYNKFQNDFGSGVVQDYDALIENLFSPSFSKTANRTQLVAKRDDLKIQLEDIKKMVGNWVIEPTKTIQSANNNDYVISYSLKTKDNVFDVIAILESSDGIKIDYIGEIYHVVES
jgi:hypothetical protein